MDGAAVFDLPRTTSQERHIKLNLVAKPASEHRRLPWERLITGTSR